MFATIDSAKVVYVPMGTYINKDGEEKTRFIRTGIRVDMADGSWWFQKFRSSSWTNHYPTTVVVSKPWEPLITGVQMETKSFSRMALQREYGGRPRLLQALQDGIAQALEEEAEKRAARRAA